MCLQPVKQTVRNNYTRKRAPNKIKRCTMPLWRRNTIYLYELNRVEYILKVVLPKIFLQLLYKENSYSSTKCQACASTKPGKARVAKQRGILKKIKNKLPNQIFSLLLRKCSTQPTQIRWAIGPRINWLYKKNWYLFEMLLE